MVDKEKQHRIDELFVAACEIPQSQLKEFLDQACGNDAEVRTAVERLLAADRELHLDDQNLAGAPIGGIVKEVQDAAEEAVGQAREIEAGAADRNLLFGIVALQMNFIGRDALIRAMNAWVLNKTQPIENILVEHGEMGEKTNLLLGALVDKHLEYHDHNPVKSLAALSSVADIKQSLEGIQDTELTQSIVHLGSDSRKSPDTPTISFGEQTKKGGRFRVLRPHKEGGLGAVSVALDEELNREVALKEVLKKYSNYQSAHDRLRVEAEITGGLEHPGIVPVYGLGSYQDGSPFYCMRFIKGDSLKDAIRTFQESKTKLSASSRNLELRGLLRRFIDVCDAVSYAHSRRVLHRDLKPGNIMLGKYGETLVVDWGLAKATGQDQEVSVSADRPIVPRSGSTAAPTLAGSTIGTPQYMSPEQAEGRIDQLGPATDVYSLGATLYCLLTGQAAFTDKEPEDILRKVRKGEFPRPTAIESTVPKALEAICLKAMKKEPDLRYSSPSDLGMDIERWLADEPVTAYADPWTDRLARSVRRHRTTFATISAILVMTLVGLGAVSTVTTNKNAQLTKANLDLLEARNLAEENRGKAVQQKERAEDNLTTARTIALYILEIAEENLSRVPGKEAFRESMMDRCYDMFVSVNEQTQGDPQAQFEFAKVARMSGNVKRLLGKFDTGRERLVIAAKSLEKLHEASKADSELHDYLIETYRDLGTLEKAAGDFRSANIALEKAADRIEVLITLRPNEPAFRKTNGTINLELVSLQLDQLEYGSALRSAEECVESYRPFVEKENPNPQDVTVYLLSVGRQVQLLNQLDRHVEAKIAFGQAEKTALAMLEKGPRRDIDFSYGRLLLNSAEGYFVSELVDEKARIQIEEAIKIFEKLTIDFPQTISYQYFHGDCLRVRGLVLWKLDLLDEANDSFDSAIEVLKRVVGTSDKASFEAKLAQAYSDSAKVFLERENPETARERLNSAIQFAKEAGRERPASLEIQQQLKIYEEALRDLKKSAGN